NVRMYVCGPTVYDRAHLGNARPAIVFDVLFRLLRLTYGEHNVTYVRNFTDVDDKINARAARDNKPISDITEETIAWYLDDMAAVGVGLPTYMPRATEYIAQMRDMIEDLIAKGHAYTAQGHALFAVDSYADYGGLSGRSVEDMIAGARVEVAPYKRNPMDFVLWKPAEDHEPGWDSPWGRGRPGWHIECSAMARDLLGDAFDIHGGGNDLMFPHHENEIAQSRCAHTDAGFARHWMHNGMINVDGRKMSKSLGNFLTVEDLRGQAPGEVLRLALISTHYRGVLDWTEQKVSEASETLRKWGALVDGVEPSAEVPATVLDALSDDLNTPLAIAEMHKLARAGEAAQLASAMALLNLAAPEAVAADDNGIEALLIERTDARAAKDFARADEIRKGLEAAGVVVMDKPGEASEWRLGPNFDANKLEALK
ncbi:MAG: cysteine--tRNA ligase, partial [Paracoccaceae bacterium]|nr:cysteine--tRNA ligase [Paracoccaceae bacterium]